MTALLWITRNWKFVALMALAGLLGAMGLRIAYLDNKLEKSERRTNQLERYKEDRLEYDEIDADLGGDASASRELLRRRKRSSPSSSLRRNR